MINCNDRRNEFIEQVVKGKTFADVGGLWQVDQEKLSVAHEAGAVRVTLIDRCLQSHPDWDQFYKRMEQLDISPIVINENLFDIDAKYDVVYCSGVVYHCPDFQMAIRSLLEMTREYLILSSCICRPSYGQLISPENGFYIPELSDKDVNLKEYWKHFTSHDAIGITTPSNFLPNDYASFWHLPSIQYFRNTIQKFNGKIIDESTYWHGNAHALFVDTRT